MKDEAGVKLLCYAAGYLVAMATLIAVRKPSSTGHKPISRISHDFGKDFEDSVNGRMKALKSEENGDDI